MFNALNIYSNKYYDVYHIKKYMIPSLFNMITYSLEKDTKFNFSYPKNYHDKRILIAEYIYYIRESCKYVKYNIHESDIIKKQINSHTFNKYKKNYNNIKERLAFGKGIEPYLTNKATNFNYSDKMYDDWDMLHLHLGKIKHRKAIRTNFTLRLIISNNDAYFIKLSPHSNNKKKINTYANVNDIQILYNNWPDAIWKFDNISKGKKIHQSSNEIMYYRKYKIKQPNILYDKAKGINFRAMIPSFGIMHNLAHIDYLPYKLTILINYMINKNIVNYHFFKSGYFKIINNRFITFYSTVNNHNYLVFFIPYIHFLFYIMGSNSFPQVYTFKSKKNNLNIYSQIMMYEDILSLPLGLVKERNTRMKLK